MVKWASKWLGMYSQRHRFLKFFWGSYPQTPLQREDYPLSYSPPARGLRRSVQAFDFQCPP